MDPASPRPSAEAPTVVRQRIPALDGLRGLACLLVLMGHFLTSNSARAPFLAHAFSQFWSGVDLFFVLSGFVIFLSLLRLRAAIAGRWDFLWAFLNLRFWRIMPVYALLVGSFLVIPVLCPSLAHTSLFADSIPRWCYFVFGQSVWSVVHQHRGADYVNVTWSLCAEVIFYGLAFVLVLVLPARRRIGACAALIAASYLARAAFAFGRGDLAAAYMFPLCRMDGFMMGGIAALLYSAGRLPATGRGVLNALLLATAPVYLFLAYYGRLQSDMVSVFFSYTFYSVFYCLVVVRVLDGGFAPLSRGPLALFGRVSYFVYLFQVPALRAAESLFADPVARLGAALVLVVGAASLSWVFMEAPLIALGRSLAAAPRAAAA